MVPPWRRRPTRTAVVARTPPTSAPLSPGFRRVRLPRARGLIGPAEALAESQGDGDALSGDAARGVAGKKDDRPRHLLGSHDPAGGILLGPRGPDLVDGDAVLLGFDGGPRVRHLRPTHPGRTALQVTLYGATSW